MWEEIRKRAVSARIYISHAWEFMAANWRGGGARGWNRHRREEKMGNEDGTRCTGRGMKGCYAQLLGLILR